MAPPKETRFSNYSPARTGTNFAMAQGKGSMPTKEATRRVFFDNRTDISDDRLERRQKQYDELQAFKQSEIEKGNYVKDSKGNPVRDSKGDYVYTNTYTFDTDSSSPTFGQQVGYSVTDKMQDLAFKYGPTFREIGSDIGYGLGSMAKGYGIPIVSSVMRGVNAVKGGVEQLWDKVREKPSQQTFPEFRGESENYFNNIDTGISQVDPNNMLVQIAKANEGRFDDTSTFQDQLANATAMNLNIPSPTDVAQTISDYYTAAAQGVNLNTPIGDININPLAEKVFLNGGIKELQEPGDIGYGGSFDPNTLDYNVGIGARLPYDVNFSAGASSSDIPGMSFSKNIGPVNTSFNLSEQGGSLGLNTVIDPLKTIFPGSSVGTPINIGASVDSRGNINPNVGFMVPFNSGGLGYMFK